MEIMLLFFCFWIGFWALDGLVVFGISFFFPPSIYQLTLFSCYYCFIAGFLLDGFVVGSCICLVYPFIPLSCFFLGWYLLVCLLSVTLGPVSTGNFLFVHVVGSGLCFCYFYGLLDQFGGGLW